MSGREKLVELDLTEAQVQSRKMQPSEICSWYLIVNWKPDRYSCFHQMIRFEYFQIEAYLK